MHARIHRRKADVLYAMPAIRLLFALRGQGLDPHPDDAIADVLLDTHVASSWMSVEHSTLTFAAAPTSLEPRSARQGACAPRCTVRRVACPLASPLLHGLQR